MREEKVISGQSEAEVWQQVAADISQNPDLLSYEAVLIQEGRRVALDIDIDLGGGFESGYATTSFVAQLQDENGYRLALHKEDFLDAAGKFFGMQDVVIGYPELDEKLIIKTNDETKTKALFSDALIRQTIGSLQHFHLHITHHSQNERDTKDTFLELNIEEGITDTVRLQEIYHAFFQLVILLDSSTG